MRIRCLSCGSRSEVTPGDLDARDLRAQRHVHRNCRICRGVTQHEVLATDDSFARPSTGFRATPSGTPARGPAGDDAPRPMALIIEDDADARAILAKALVAARFDTVTVGDGREALRILAREDFAVILSDLNMPELDGRKLYAFLEKNMPDARRRVIFVTGETGNPDTREFLEGTGQPFLSKPVELPRLYAFLEVVAARNA